MRGEIPLRHTLEQPHLLNCKATKAIKHLGQVYRTGDSAQLAVIQGSSSAKRCSPSTSNCWEGDGVTKVRDCSHLAIIYPINISQKQNIIPLDPAIWREGFPAKAKVNLLGCLCLAVLGSK